MSFKDSARVILLCCGAWILSTQLRTPTNPRWEYGSDSSTYVDLARNLTAGQGYVHGPGPAYLGALVDGENKSTYHNVHTLPGYPALLAVFYKTVGPDRAPYALAFLLFTLMALCAFDTARLLFGHRLSSRLFWILFVSFQILQPVLILQLQATGRDLAATAFIAFFVTVLVRLAKAPQPGVLIATLLGIAAVAAVSVRTNSFALMLPLLAGTAFIFWRERAWRKLAAIAFATTLVVLCLVAWGLHLKTYTGRLMLGTDKGSSFYTNVAMYNLPSEVVAHDRAEVTAAFEKRLAEGIPVEQAMAESSDHWQAKADAFLRAHPLMVLKLIPRNLWRIFFEKDYVWMPKLLYMKFAGAPIENYEQFRQFYGQPHAGWGRALFALAYVACYIVYVFIPALCLLGVPLLAYRLIRDGQGLVVLMAVSAILFLIATSILGASMPRYRMPASAITFYCILAIVSMLPSFKRS